MDVSTLGFGFWDPEGPENEKKTASDAAGAGAALNGVSRLEASHVYVSSFSVHCALILSWGDRGEHVRTLPGVKPGDGMGTGTGTGTGDAMEGARPAAPARAGSSDG